MPANKTVIAVCGPTAAGKTDLAVGLATKYKTQIISADSRQCFRELSIGVAKPSETQLETVKHYFIDSHSVFENINAGTFEKYALEAADTIFAHHDILVLAGGTGLYVRAFLEGLDEIPEVDRKICSDVRKNFGINGITWLRDQLKVYDPLFAVSGEMENPQRMMRALEVALFTGRSILDYHSATSAGRNFRIQKIFIDLPRDILYERINKRVDKMMEDGLLEEARRLFPHRRLNALQTVGYKELFDFFDNKISLDKAVELIRRNTRHYAKRQLTWFRKYFVDDNTEIINHAG